MEFLNEDAVKELGLTPEQVEGITPKFNEYISNQKLEWDKKANENAEGILSGAVKYLQEKTGVKEDRQQGEKYADYLARISDKAFEGKKSELETAKAEYDKKLKEFKGDDATKEELQKAKDKLDAAQKQLADYDTLKEKADKYEEATKSLSELKRQAAFGNVKPAFNKDANEYEVKAKWAEFQKRVEEKFNIEFVDGEYIAVDKENQYKQTKLSELVANDEELKGITSERVVPGLGSKGKSFKVDGLNTEVPEEAKTDTAKRAEFIKEIMAKEGLTDVTNPAYSKRFAELNKKIKGS